MPSVFTRIINRELPARILFEDGDFIVIIPKDHFVNPGHILVIPKLEIDVVWELPPDIYTSLWILCRRLSSALKEITLAERIGIAVEGFSVPHVHVHLCPLNGVAELDPHRQEEWSEADRDVFSDNFRALLNEDA